MSKNIILSVVIPAYNAAATLRRAVESVYKIFKEERYEILIVENGSTDTTYQEAEKIRQDLGSVVRILKSDKGVSNARNKGIENARGKWITFLDADDELNPRALKALLKRAASVGRAASMGRAESMGQAEAMARAESMAREEKGTCPDFVMGAMKRVYDKKAELHYLSKEEKIWQGKETRDFLQMVLKPETGAGFIWGKIFRRDFLLQNDLLLNPELSMGEDAEFMLRAAAAASRIVYDPLVIYNYHFNPESAVRTYREDYPQDYLRTLEAVGRTISELEKNQDKACGDAEIKERQNRDSCDAEIKEIQDKSGCDSEIMQSYYSFCLYHLLLTAVNYSFNPAGGKSAGQQMKEFRKLLENPIYAEAMKHVRYGDFSASRRAVLFLIVRKLYPAVRAAVMVRQTQFSLRTKH